MKPVMGNTADEILCAFKAKSSALCGIRVVEADLIGSGLRFRMTGQGALGVVAGPSLLRDASASELLELEDGLELGQVEIYSLPMDVSGRNAHAQKEVLHQATGNPLDDNSEAARAQRARLARAYPTSRIG